VVSRPVRKSGIVLQRTGRPGIPLSPGSNRSEPEKIKKTRRKGTVPRGRKSRVQGGGERALGVRNINVGGPGPSATVAPEKGEGAKPCSNYFVEENGVITNGGFGKRGSNIVTWPGAAGVPPGVGGGGQELSQHWGRENRSCLARAQGCIGVNSHKEEGLFLTRKKKKTRNWLSGDETRGGDREVASPGGSSKS